MSNEDDNDKDKDKKSFRRPTIKPISRITSSAFSRLKNAKCFAEVDRRVRLGWSSMDVASAIHEEFGEMTETPIKYLKKLIDRYRNSIPPSELSIVSPTSLLGRNLAKRMSQGLDELAEVERLYRMQMARIEIDMDNERKITKLLPTTGNEIFIAMKLLKQSSDLKMDMGLVKRQLGSVEMTGQLAAEASERYGKDSVGKVLADPESRRKVLGLAERLLAIGSKANLDAAFDAADSKIIEAEGTEVKSPPPADEVEAVEDEESDEETGDDQGE